MPVSSFSSKRLSAAYVSGEMTDSVVKGGVARGDYPLVFFTPENDHHNKRGRKVIEDDAERLKAFVIDEAHCVKKW